MAGRTEARIFTSIWRDPYFLSLEEGPQRLYLFLVSQEDLAYCGVIPLRPARWARKAAHLTLPDVECYLKTLEGTAYPYPNPDQEITHTPLTVIDPDTEELLVRSLMRRDGIWKQPNLLKLAMESAGQVESLRIRGALLAELRRLPLEETGSAQVKTLVADFITMLEKGGPYPTPYPPPNPTDEPSDDPTEEDYARAQGSGGSVGTPGVFPDPLFPGSPQPFAPQEPKRGHRLPEDFPLTDEMRAWAAEEAPHVDVDRETKQFRDYWHDETGARAAKKNWNGAWRFWMRRAEDRQAPRQRASRQDDKASLKARVAARGAPQQGEMA